MTMLFKARMEALRGEALRSASHPLFSICRLLGILPYNYDFTISTRWLQYSFFFCLTVFLNNTLVKWVILAFYEINYLKEAMDKLLNVLQSLVENLCILAQLISLVVYRSGYSQPCIQYLLNRVVLNSFLQCIPVRELKYLYNKVGMKVLLGLREYNEFKPINYYSRYGVLICLVKVVLQLGSQFYNHGLGLDFSTYTYVSTVIGVFVFSMINLEYCGILELLRYQFRVVTEELRPNQYTLVPLTKRHHVLLEITTTLNEIFSWQLLVMCTGIFINLVTMLYVCIQALQKLESLLVLGTAGMCLWQIFLLFSLAVSCEETREKAEDFSNDLFKLMRESKDLCSNEKLHLYVTMKQTLNFTACGFFTIGYPLVTSIIAAATTYLVILVQFSMSDPATTKS